MNNLSFLKNLKGKKILIAPLDWGLGHATRSSVLIEALKRDNEIHIASSGLALTWLKRTYPRFDFHVLPSYNVNYRFKMMWLNIFISTPQILKSIRVENRIVHALVKKHKYDLIIADHRFGTRNKRCRSVVIAHQIQIPHPNPVFATLSSFLNRRLLNIYDEVWVPDYAISRMSLSGELSNSTKLKGSKYIGPLSMMDGTASQAEKDIDIAVILSGPEPSRTNLELKLAKVLENFKESKLVLIRGSNRPLSNTIAQSTIFKTIVHLADHKKVTNIMSRTKIIICRSGYSTIMDLEALNRKAILIPTNNQPEQEYLASYHCARGNRCLSEEDIDQKLIPMLHKIE
ncbi:MAG: hypothetical protein ACI9FN_004011 [Saprospiraceae bacterium]